MQFVPLIVLASGMLCVASVLAFVLSRRYGWRFAALMPVLALIIFSAMLWQRGGFGAENLAEMVVWVLVASSPILVGTGIGILLARRRRG